MDATDLVRELAIPSADKCQFVAWVEDILPEGDATCQLRHFSGCPEFMYTSGEKVGLIRF